MENSFPITISLIGTTGVGKSSIANALFKGSKFLDKETFLTSSLHQACTMMSEGILGNFFLAGENQNQEAGLEIKIVDNAGVLENPRADIDHIR